ncbi:MAG: tetratricopeptide repeat protein [Brevinematia bacterium]
MNKKILANIIIILVMLANVISHGSYESAYNKYLKGNITDAISEITKDIFSGTKDYRSYFLMIKILKENTKDYKQAIEYTMEGIRLFPDKEREFSLELGELYYLSGKYSQAEQILLKYNQKYPQDQKCLYLLGKNYFSQGKFYKAVSSFEATISLGDTSISTYEYLGKSYRKIGNYNKALEILSYIYNQTRREEILGMIIEISSIIDVDYSLYLSLKKTLTAKQPKLTTTQNISQKPIAQKTETSLVKSSLNGNLDQSNNNDINQVDKHDQQESNTETTTEN